MTTLYRRLKGTGVALITPFHKDGSVDFKGLKKLVESLISAKVEYLVPLGTTGESVTLNEDEKIAVLDFVIEINDRRLPIVLGLGGNNTQQIINHFKHYDFDGVDAILSVSPYYNRPTQKGIFQHYKMIGNAAPVPVILYNVPARTGSNMLAETTLQLADEVPNIIGMKEASGNIEQVMQIIKNKPDNFLVISGDDMITLPLMAAGADGVISVVANAYPRQFSEMVRQCLKGNFEKAAEYHYNLMDFTHHIFTEGNPVGIKAALCIMHMCEEHVRLPLVSASRGAFNKLEAIIKAI
jgi:4-hydroxy-tetrahydrodipicolinate synthase